MDTPVMLKESLVTRDVGTDARCKMWALAGIKMLAHSIKKGTKMSENEEV